MSEPLDINSHKGDLFNEIEDLREELARMTAIARELNDLCNQDCDPEEWDNWEDRIMGRRE